MMRKFLMRLVGKHYHEWGMWSEEYVIKVTKLYWGMVMFAEPTLEWKQKRSCKTCGILQERKFR